MANISQCLTGILNPKQTSGVENCTLWAELKHPDQRKYPEDTEGLFFWEWEGNPPDQDYYRPVYEIVPTWVSGIRDLSVRELRFRLLFATEDELIDYLVENGDFLAPAQSKGKNTYKQTKQGISNPFC